MKEKVFDNSIDLIVTDPPYNIGKDEWDKIENYIKWCGEWIKQCERVLKDNGSFYFFHNDFKVLAELQNWIKENTEFKFKQFINWNKIDESFYNYGFVQQRLSVDSMRNYYGGFTEYCLFYTFQHETKLGENSPIAKYLKKEFNRAGVNSREIAKLFPSKNGNITGCVFNWLNGDNVITKEQYLKLINDLGDNYLQKSYEKLIDEYEKARYTFNVQRVKDNLRANSNDWHYPPAEKRGHITPKPLPVIRNIVKHSSNKRDIVLDCFGGSGTTAKVCQKLNRKYILFETEKEYIKLIENRLRQRSLFANAN